MLKWLIDLFTPKKKADPAVPASRPSVSDDFDGPAGSIPDQNLWLFYLAGDKASVHTNLPRNASIDGGSNLRLTAIREQYRIPGTSITAPYTTATVTTKGRCERQYGLWTARIKFPAGAGHWPCFYLLGSSVDEVKLPKAGEIDVMEYQGSLQGSSIRVPQSWLLGTKTATVSTAAPFDVRGSWHEYWVKHEQDRVTIGVDDRTICSYTPQSLPKGASWPFNQPMFALLQLNTGTGGNKPDGLPFPVSMLVDWLKYEPLG